MSCKPDENLVQDSIAQWKNLHIQIEQEVKRERVCVCVCVCVALRKSVCLCSQCCTSFGTLVMFYVAVTKVHYNYSRKS